MQLVTNLRGRTALATLAVVVAGLVLCAAATAVTAGEPEFGLNAYDIEYAGLSEVAPVAADDTRALRGDGGVSPADAVAIASDLAPIDPVTARTYEATAARYIGGDERPVIVVVAPGGSIPLSGPVGSEFADSMVPARITGIILDAETGEFLRGFMHNGAEP